MPSRNGIKTSRGSASVGLVVTSGKGFAPTVSSSSSYKKSCTIEWQTGVGRGRLYHGAEWPPPFSLISRSPKQPASPDSSGADLPMPAETKRNSGSAVGIGTDEPSATRAIDVDSRSSFFRGRCRSTSSLRGCPPFLAREATSQSPSPELSASGCLLRTGSTASASPQDVSPLRAAKVSCYSGGWCL